VITTADVAASNGLVQVVDTVLQPTPPAPVEPSVPAVEPNEPVAPVLVSLLGTVTAMNAAGDYEGQFDTFLALVSAVDASVLDALIGDAENTLFIPTDDAFAALDTASLDKVVISDILLYHMAAGKLMAADVQAAESVTMLMGGSVQQADGVLTDNTGVQATIIGQDVEASNGVIHVINTVLLPAEL